MVPKENDAEGQQESQGITHYRLKCLSYGCIPTCLGEQVAK